MMTRKSGEVAKHSPLYARIRNAPVLCTKHLVVAKGHALRDEFSEARTAAGAMNRKSKTTLRMEGEPFDRAPDAS